MTSWCREDSWRFWRETLRPVLSPGRWDLQQDAQMKSGVTMGASIIARSSVLLGRRECKSLIRKQLISDIRVVLRPRGRNVPCGLWPIPGHKEQLKSNSRTSHLANQTLPDSFVWRLARPGKREQPQACSTGFGWVAWDPLWLRPSQIWCQGVETQWIATDGRLAVRRSGVWTSVFSSLNHL